MSGKELYNIDLNINVNGVDEGIGKLKKIDKEIDNIEKKSKKVNKINISPKGLDKMKGLTKASRNIDKIYKTCSKLKDINPVVRLDIKDGASRKIKNMENNLKSYQTLMSSQINMMKQQGNLFRNNSLDMLIGKGIKFGDNTIKITAEENVTQTVAKAKASVQNFKHSSNVKATLKANPNRALKAIQETKKKAKEFASGKYEAILTAKNKLSGTVFDKANGAINRGIKKVGRAIGIGMSALGAASFGSMVKIFSDYEKQMSAVKAVTGANAKEFSILDKQAKHLGATTEWSASQVAEGMQNLGQAGFKINEITSAMPGLLNLASEGQLQLADASNIAAGTLRAFGLNASQTGHVADVLALASSATNSNVSEMGNSMEYAAPFAKALGVSLEDTASAIGMLANVNIKGSKAGMTLRNMFTSLSGPSKEASKIMEKLGFNAFDAQGKMKQFPMLIRDLEEATRGLNRQQKAATLNKIFGDIGTTGVLSLLDMGPKKLAELTKQLEYSQGAAQKMATTRLNNLAGDITILKSATEGMFIELGTKLNPYMRQFIQWLTSKIPEIQQTLGNLIDFVGNNWESILSGLKGAVPILAGLFGMIQGFRGIMFFGQLSRDFSTLKDVLGGLLPTTGRVGGLLSSLKGGLAGLGATGGIMAAVAAFGIMAAQISKNIDLVNSLNNSFDGLGAGMSRITEGFGGFFRMLGSGGSLLGGIFKALDKVADGDFKGAWKDITSATTDFSNKTTLAINAMANTKSKASSVVAKASTREINQTKNVLKTAMNEQKNIVTGNYEAMASSVSKSLKGISNDQLSVLRGTSDNMALLLNGVRQGQEASQMAKIIQSNMKDLSKSTGFDPTKMQKDFSSAYNWIENHSAASATTISRNLNKIGKEFANTTKSQISSVGLDTAVTNMISQIHQAGPELQNAIKSNAQAMQSAFKGVDFGSSLKSQIDTVMNNLKGMDPGQASSLIQSIFSSVTQQARDMGSQSRQNFDSGFNSSQSNATSSNIFSNMAQNNGEVAYRAGAESAEKYVNGIQSKTSSANLNSDSIFNNLSSGNGDNAHEAGVQVGQQYSHGVIEGIEESKSQIQQINQNNNILQQANQMAQQVKQAYSNMYNGASNSVKQLQSVTSSTFSSLRGSATAQVNAMCSQIIAAWNAMKAVVSATVTANFVLNISTVGGMGAIPHAEGGILNEPHIGLVAEAGPEAVIPLSPSKRARGIEVFKKAGEVLGFKDSSGNGAANTSLSDSISDKTFIPSNNQKNQVVGGNNVNVKVDVHTKNEDSQKLKQEILNEVERELDNAFDHLS